MKTVKPLCILILAAIVFAAGCGRADKYSPTEPLCVSGIQKAQLITTAEDALRQMNFVIAKSDSQSGTIITRPLSGAQLLEFWRKDTVGRFNKAEANLHSIRKIVRLDISREDGGLCIKCTAITQRLSLTEDEITSTSQAYRMFSESGESMQKLKLRKGQASWLELGRDAALEKRILEKIAAKINR